MSEEWESDWNTTAQVDARKLCRLFRSLMCYESLAKIWAHRGKVLMAYPLSTRKCWKQLSLVANTVFRSATSVNAEILNMEGELGCVAPGAYADIILLETNSELPRLWLSSGI